MAGSFLSTISPMRAADPVAVSAAVKSPVEFVSQQVPVLHAPQVVELKLISTASAGEVRVRGVFLAGNGVLLTLAPAFNGVRSVLMEDDSAMAVSGWLARNADWMVVKVPTVSSAPANLLTDTRVSPGKKLTAILPWPMDNLSRGVTAMPAAGPDGAPLDPAAAVFWITILPDEILPGTPVVDEHNNLVGLIDGVEAKLHLARVRRVGEPLALLDQAVAQVSPMDWQMKSSDSDRLPFSDPAISKEVVDGILHRSAGNALVVECDQLLSRHERSTLAWYVAARGYARAGESARAVASAKMVTELASSRWEGWLLYAELLEAERQPGQALDAYYSAFSLAAPRFFYKKNGAGAGSARRGHESRDEPGDDGGVTSGVFGSRSRGEDPYGLPEGMMEEKARKQAQRMAEEPQLSPEKAMQLADARRKVALPLVQCLQKSGDGGTALQVLEILTEQDPDNFEVWMLLGRSREQAGKTPQAAEAYKRAVALNPQSVTAWSALAQIHYRMGGTSVAQEALSKVEQLAPASAATLKASWK